jgi:hypothetical protein
MTDEAKEMLVSNQMVRDAVADEVGKTHGSREFVRQIRSGEQDDGPFMRGGFAARDAMLERFTCLPKPPLEIDDE